MLGETILIGGDFNEILDVRGKIGRKVSIRYSNDCVLIIII